MLFFWSSLKVVCFLNYTLIWILINGIEFTWTICMRCENTSFASFLLYNAFYDIYLTFAYSVNWVHRNCSDKKFVRNMWQQNNRKWLQSIYMVTLNAVLIAETSHKFLFSCSASYIFTSKIFSDCTAVTGHGVFYHFQCKMLGRTRNCSCMYPESVIWHIIRDYTI